MGAIGVAAASAPPIWIGARRITSDVTPMSLAPARVGSLRRTAIDT